MGFQFEPEIMRLKLEPGQESLFDFLKSSGKVTYQLNWQTDELVPITERTSQGLSQHYNDNHLIVSRKVADIIDKMYGSGDSETVATTSGFNWDSAVDCVKPDVQKSRKKQEHAKAMRKAFGLKEW